MDFGIAQKYQKPYHYASQKHQLHLLKKFGGNGMSPRTLNRKLRKLEDGGYIKRKKRHLRDPQGKFRPGSTLTYILARGFYHMARSLKKALKIFSFYRLPKMALNMFKTTDYSSLVDKPRAFDGGFVQQRMDATVFRTA